MSSRTSTTSAAQKKRKRSSLFVDRLECPINDSSDAAHTAASISDANNYLAQLKNCKRSWIRYEMKLKSQLDSTSALKAQRKEYEDVQNNYLDYLDEQDRKFIEEMSLLSEGSANQKKIDAIKNDLQIVIAHREEDKKHCSLLFENINQTYRQCIAKKFNEFGAGAEIGLPDGWGEVRVSENAPQVLEYNSDLSDLEE